MEKLVSVNQKGENSFYKAMNRPQQNSSIVIIIEDFQYRS